MRSSFPQSDVTQRSIAKHRKFVKSAPNLNSVQGVNELIKSNEDEHKKQIKAIEASF